MGRGIWTSVVLALVILGSATVPAPGSRPGAGEVSSPGSAPAEPRCRDERGPDRPVDPCLELLAR